MPENPYALSQLKRLRNWRRLTQQELSVRSGIKVSTIQKHERGAIRTASLDVAASLAEALQVPVEALFSVDISNRMLEQLSAKEAQNSPSPEESPHDQ
ncbi:helix-turn-helix domain-containing protein [Deinococcus sp. S9]|uniref:helix-turn-helix domain-containing protein n=1 Tax=Deinococcus sp. S9 TaxID=2545754 RepID=UPI001055FA0F|nr:helix-turn-helix transcriptional regulator [Deinococcus sp. S9]TDE85973.1 XRE family transcriptional regulator [Deinococcus sp. S9]